MLIRSDDFAAAYTFGSLGLSSDAALHAATAWKQRAWKLAIALSNEGHFSWEDLRQAFLREQLADAHEWAACKRCLDALSRVVHAAGLVDAGELAQLGRWADRAAARE